MYVDRFTEANTCWLDTAYLISRNDKLWAGTRPPSHASQTSITLMWPALYGPGCTTLVDVVVD